MEDYKKSFARSHETTEINTNSISHSSNMNLSYSSLSQAQKITSFISSVKIVLLTLKQNQGRDFTLE